MTPAPTPGRRHVDARFVFAMMGAMLAVADAFRASSSSPLRISAAPPELPWLRPASTTRATITCPSMTTTTTAAAAVSPEAAFAPIISELKTRTADAPSPLEDNESAQRHADQLGKAFEVGGDGNLVGGFAEEVRLAGALSMDTFVVRYRRGSVCARQHQGYRRGEDRQRDRERDSERVGFESFIVVLPHPSVASRKMNKALRFAHEHVLVFEFLNFFKRSRTAP